MTRRVFYSSWLLAANIITPMGWFAQWNDSVQEIRRRSTMFRAQIPIRPATDG